VSLDSEYEKEIPMQEPTVPMEIEPVIPPVEAPSEEPKDPIVETEKVVDPPQQAILPVPEANPVAPVGEKKKKKDKKSKKEKKEKKSKKSKKEKKHKKEKKTEKPKEKKPEPSPTLVAVQDLKILDNGHVKKHARVLPWIGLDPMLKFLDG